MAQSAALNPRNWTTPWFLWRMLEKRPDDSRRGFRQNYISPSMFPFENVYERQILVERAEAQNPLAGLYSVKGLPLPADDIGKQQAIMTIQDIKSTRDLDTQLWTNIVELGDLVTAGAGQLQATRRRRAKVLQELTRLMNFCDDQVDTSIEYLAAQALQGAITWPPADNDGNTITNPPDYWNGVNIQFTHTLPLESDKVQAITTLVDHEGNNPGSSVRLAWSNSSADIFGAIRTIKQIMSEKYAVMLNGGTMLMSTVTRDYLYQNANLQEYLRGTGHEQTGARNFMGDQDLVQILETAHQLKVQTYDSFWTYLDMPSGNNPAQRTTKRNVRFLPHGTVVFIPPNWQGSVGARMGTAELEREGGDFAPGKYAWSFRDNVLNNYARKVGVNLVAWPLFEYYDWFVLTGVTG